MKYDVIVIGGGPAGIMAAGQAGKAGLKVLLLEKNNRLGVKLLITGNGRCNITNVSHDWRSMLDQYGKNGKFLFSAFGRFGNQEVINFFESRGIKTKVESNGKVFPVSDSGLKVLDALISFLKEAKVEIRYDAKVESFASNKNRIEKIILASGEELYADKFIVTTGGKSYPGTGSTGDGYVWARSFGHTILEPTPTLVPINTKENYQLQGLSLRDVNVIVFKNNKKIFQEFGELIFTHEGLSGPAIINLSRKIKHEKLSELKVIIDLIPGLDFAKMDHDFQRMFQENGQQTIKNVLSKRLPLRLALLFLNLAEIEEDKKVNTISKEERKRLVHLVKEFELNPSGMAGFDKAVITSGGIDLREVDPKSMRSKLTENLYFAGEILDLDGPTGGYNLQICWSTGFVAGSAIN